ncbi:MAG: glycosyltransferase [Bacteroidetes bacterium]|nr:glycosyltransferase [Bacteroidota bacterium]
MAKIKVACMGNMNNNMFVLMRYLRGFDVDADLLLFDKEIDHFSPDTDSVNVEDYEKHIKQLSWGGYRSFFTTSKQKIRAAIEDYDVIIGCGFAPAFFQKIRRKLDIFLPYGSDMLYYPYAKFIFSTPSLRIFSNTILARYQTKGIRNCKVKILSTIKDYYYSVNKFGTDFLGLQSPLVYLPDFEALDFKNMNGFEYKDQFDELRAKNDVMIFNHSRQIWKTFKGDIVAGKGNDKLIKGFARYLKEAKKSAVLILFEKGVDVKYSKQLIGELGIDDHVKWMPKMPRKNLLYGLQMADFAVDTMNAGGIGGSGYEAMILGTPLFNSIPWGQDEYDKLLLGKPVPPVIEASTEDHIYENLLRNEKEPEFYKEKGLKGKQWIYDYRGSGLVEKWIHLIEDIYHKREINEQALQFN